MSSKTLHRITLFRLASVTSQSAALSALADLTSAMTVARHDGPLLTLSFRAGQIIPTQRTNGFTVAVQSSFRDMEMKDRFLRCPEHLECYQVIRGLPEYDDRDGVCVVEFWD